MEDKKESKESASSSQSTEPASSAVSSSQIPSNESAPSSVSSPATSSSSPAVASASSAATDASVSSASASSSSSSSSAPTVSASQISADQKESSTHEEGGDKEDGLDAFEKKAQEFGKKFGQKASAVAEQAVSGLFSFVTTLLDAGDPLIVDPDDIGIVKIADRVFAMPFPSSDQTHIGSLLELSSNYMKATFPGRFLVFNLAEKAYDYSKFDNQACFSE